MATIRRHPDRPGVQLLDPIEGVRYDLYVSEDDVDVQQRSGDTVSVPTDAVARVTSERLTLPKRLELIVRDEDLQVVGTVDPDDPVVPHLPADGPYLIEVTSAPLKLYLQVTSAFSVAVGEGRLDITFPGVEPVDIAIRSFHEQPAGTITVGDSVRDEMEAISRFGSALKTTTPERAWPTLRGHPPLVEAGDAFDVPDGIERPATGITLHVPPDREYIYPAAPLAYYLGARLEPTSGDPRLTAAGQGTPIDAEAYTDDLNTLLRRIFVLDVAARSEGMYPFRTAAHDRIDDVVDGRVDWSGLFDSPIDERVAAYLAPRFDGVATEAVLPEWHLTTDLAPTQSTFEFLPWVAKDLSLVRLPDRVAEAELTPEPEPVSDFLRQPNEEEPERTDRPAGDGDGQGSMGDGLASMASPDSTRVRPPSVDTAEHRWIGEDIPLGAQRADRAALQRQSSRLPPEQDDHVITIDVVCNDEAMTAESVVEEVYGVRDFLEYDVRTHYGLTRGELREVLGESSDLFHYIGHVDDDGLQCVDGALDARTVSGVGVDAFLLNACQSYQQGKALLDAGSLAGVVTLSNVSNVSATRLGRQLARLLDTGLRFRSALAILQAYVPMSSQYIVLGAGDLQLVQSESGAPNMAELTQPADDRFELSLSYFPASGYDIGSLSSPVIDAADTHYLVGETAGPYRVSRPDLLSFLQREDVPVGVHGELMWSSDIAMALGGDTSRSLGDVVDAKWSPEAVADGVEDAFSVRGPR